MGPPGPGGLRRKASGRVKDTQWPRYEVFLQPGADRPHAHAGSVHAPDPEMALLNGRDVFVRRPECTSMWIVPASAVFSRTREELEQGVLAPGLGRKAEAGADQRGASPAPRAAEYIVFGKLEQKGTMVHLGSVHGANEQQALEEALRQFAPRRPLVLWLVEQGRILQNRSEEAGPFFEPARDKPFRDQAYYRIQTALRRLRSGRNE